MSTFNGEDFLMDQLDSILNQSYEHWELLIRDDGSTDKTLEIITNFQEQHQKRIKIVSTMIGGNSSASFMSMLDFVSAPYVMFCDQDDVWTNDKVEISINEIQRIEKTNAAALFFTDMSIVDMELNETASSFFENQKLNPAWSKKSNFAFAQSVAAGCTMIFTKKLTEKIHGIEATLFQHDHWMLMHAAYYGEVGYSLKKTVLYRQHGANAVGSHNVGRTYFLSKFTAISKIIRRWLYIRKKFGSKVSIRKIVLAKWEINKQRLMAG